MHLHRRLPGPRAHTTLQLLTQQQARVSVAVHFQALHGRRGYPHGASFFVQLQYHHAHGGTHGVAQQVIGQEVLTRLDAEVRRSHRDGGRSAPP